jgi:hypothetical protein
MSQNTRRTQENIATAEAVARSADIDTAQSSSEQAESRDERPLKKAKPNPRMKPSLPENTKPSNNTSPARAAATAASVQRKRRLPWVPKSSNVTSKAAAATNEDKERIAKPSNGESVAAAASNEDEDMSDATEDEEMSDAPEDDGRIRASDSINNIHMPTDPVLEAAYLAEVGTRYLYLSHTPLDDTGSKISPENRAIINDHTFLGKSNVQSLQPHLGRGGGTQSERGVSRLFHRWTSR